TGRFLGVHQVGVHHRVGVGQPRRQHADRDRGQEQRAADHEVGAEFHVYLMRGSIIAQAMSTSVLTTRKNSTTSRMQPCTAGMSRWNTLSTSSEPTPGQENSFSTTTAWPIS